eukprot:3612813-Prymnesium_polylepis.1
MSSNHRPAAWAVPLGLGSSAAHGSGDVELEVVDEACVAPIDGVGVLELQTNRASIERPWRGWRRWW